MRHDVPPAGESVFAVEANSIRFGPGVLSEAGPIARDLGLKRVALFTDANLARQPCLAELRQSLAQAGVEAVVYDETRIEPTDRSFLAAAAFAAEGRFEGFVSLGGGSVIDTAKAANLYSTWPADFLDYVAAPYGPAKPVPGALKPHLACPTTSGTGSECTGVTVFDFEGQHIKTVVADRRLRPTMALIDPTTTHSLPAGVVASTGFDVLTHAIESYTARPFTVRPRPEKPAARPMSQGANPWSDMGSLAAIRLGGRYLERAVKDAQDHEARHQVMYAATLAGIAFGNSGVHIPHAMSYAVAGLCHRWTATGYESAAPMVPHGISVVLNAPAAFRFTAPACPERHREAAEALGADLGNVPLAEAGRVLADRLVQMMKATGLPNGLAALGYGESDLDALAKGASTQPRLLVNSPRPAGEAELKSIFAGSLRLW
ncbi:MAG: iron-containing alcohol dehydrogenase [Rhodospirillales bacterium]|nr:iron-containing alcohol dehydrogenase [Rhodospirillales bacterium]